MGAGSGGRSRPARPDGGLQSYRARPGRPRAPRASVREAMPQHPPTLLAKSSMAGEVRPWRGAPCGTHWPAGGGRGRRPRSGPTNWPRGVSTYRPKIEVQRRRRRRRAGEPAPLVRRSAPAPRAQGGRPGAWVPIGERRRRLDLVAGGLVGQANGFGGCSSEAVCDAKRAHSGWRPAAKGAASMARGREPGTGGSHGMRGPWQAGAPAGRCSMAHVGSTHGAAARPHGMHTASARRPRLPEAKAGCRAPSMPGVGV
ncbi:MAG: hypothetical protein J3K34DRAFT_17184 [Monoraphidium minutum]|nr:MAG: hypothetical protein J3K34DRAFT_17184 [Monoraphidium minutum]